MLYSDVPQPNSLSLSLTDEVARRQTTTPPRRVVCYYTNWSVYRKGLAKYTPQNINPYLCTHLVYAFGGLTDEFEVKPFDSYQDIEQGEGCEAGMWCVVSLL